MARPELGTKRHCLNCGAKYYDLNREPIACPSCGTVISLETGGASRAKKPVEDEAETEVATEAEAEDGPEFVSLEDADAEQSGGDAPDVEDDVEDIGDDEDDPFLADDEDEDDDKLSNVSGIIGDVSSDEEES